MINLSREWEHQYHFATNLGWSAINRRDRRSIGVWYLDIRAFGLALWLSGNIAR